MASNRIAEHVDNLATSAQLATPFKLHEVARAKDLSDAHDRWRHLATAAKPADCAPWPKQRGRSVLSVNEEWW